MNSYSIGTMDMTEKADDQGNEKIYGPWPKTWSPKQLERVKEKNPRQSIQENQKEPF